MTLLKTKNMDNFRLGMEINITGLSKKSTISVPYHILENAFGEPTIYFEDGKIELFDLRDDISEINDLSAKLPDKVAELHTRMKAWRQSIGAEIPEHNPNYDPKNDGRW